MLGQSRAALRKPFSGWEGCKDCGRPWDRWRRCRRRTCPGYAPLWAHDWKHLLIRCLLNLEGVALITITAPGEQFGLTWDRSVCGHSREERCSGPQGCRVHPAAAATWNGQAERSWGKLHRVAAQIARRRVGPGSLVGAKVWETQARGVLHLHLVVPFGTFAERARAREYVTALETHGERHGFGFVSIRHRFDGATGGARAAGYCGKYVGKAAGAEMSVRRPIYIGSFLTLKAGLTMRLLRWRRHIWHLWGFRPAAADMRSLVTFLQAIRPLQSFRTSVQPCGP